MKIKNYDSAALRGLAHPAITRGIDSYPFGCETRMVATIPLVAIQAIAEKEHLP
jgi:hypothetical protein